MTARKPNGEARVVAEWFDNLIVDDGLNRLGTGGAFTRCMVGSGSATPDPLDTGLGSSIGTSNSPSSSSTGYTATAPYYGWARATWRFNPGVADGNLSEIGVGWASGLFSRALIKDALGDPTTITILPEEYLDITYEVRVYPPLDDVELTIDIGGTSHDVTIRACGVGTSAWNPTYLIPIGANGGFAVSSHSGAIGAITGSPTGTTGPATSTTPRTYVDDSYEMTIDVFFGLDRGNIGGIRSIKFGQQTVGTFQAEFDPVIPKDATKTLSIPFTFSWARKV